jgi:outer membrane murein-binding lipoprotein Lpp
MERVDEWVNSPFEEGYGELQDLADESFSGVVRAGRAELYMTAGTVVDIREGTVEDFEDADGTLYEAPSPALPLLAVMQAQDADARAEYYTEDTGLGDVDSKLADGGFTGYVELSENVLSGDYFVVYHQGRSMSVAFVGPEGRVKTGEDARERATEEIGIYRVYPADIDAVGLPDPAPAPAPGSEPAPESEETETATATVGPVGETADEGGGAGAEPAAAEGQTAAEADASTEGHSGSVDRHADDGVDETGPDAGGETTSESAPSGPAGSGPTGPGASRSRTQGATQAEPDRDHLETRSIPSLDPGRTQTDDRGQEESGSGSADPLGHPEAGTAVESDSHGRDPDSGPATQRREDAGSAGASGEQDGESADRTEDTGGTEPDTAVVEELEAEIADSEAEVDRLEDELAAVREERDDLGAEVERLNAELDRLESEFGAATDREERLGSREALEGTDIFVRYRSKGDPTLSTAHDSGVRQEEVVGNLLLEKHTQFDADAVSVGGGTYGEFLEARVEYQFVEWVARELLFEIRDTGHTDPLQTLYDALPRIDRAELGGSVDSVRTENGEETRSTEQFDVVYRDRMGDPLLVANINDSREAATESMMTDLVTAAERVGRENDGFAAAFLVTKSFFEPGALETASEATRSGFLKRSKRKSFVNLSRKRGYHLCLVEARSENFSLSVPEL